MPNSVVNIIGGLGNQMFQYAFGLALRETHGHDVLFNINEFTGYGLHHGYELEKVFSLRESYISENELIKYVSPTSLNFFINLCSRALTKYRVLTGNAIYEKKENEFKFKGVDFESLSKSGLYVRGYWQSYKYFENISVSIRDKFTFPDIVCSKNLMLLDFMKNKNTVSLHVRRGDYVNHELLGGICDNEYYRNSIKLINEHIQDPVYVIFSNDIKWCKDNLELNELHSRYVDWNTGLNSYIDMQLMSLCDHNIIANSSFSWWGAWLNNNKNKRVVSPSKWVNQELDTSDMLPLEWIKI